MSSSSSNKIYFKNLDGIRYIAAMMVFLQHVVLTTFILVLEPGSVADRMVRIFFNGGTGVSIFFVLSGFLITYLIITEKNVSGTVNVKNFYLRRFLRIWPLYFAVILFSFGIYPLLKEIFWVNNPLGSNIWYHLTFLSNFDVINIEHNCDGLAAMSQNITWSVSIEEQFYLFWPLIFLLPIRVLPYVFSLIILMSLGFRIVNVDDPPILYFHTFAVLLDLVVGGFFAWVAINWRRAKSFFENSSTVFYMIIVFLFIAVQYWSTEFVFGEYYPAFERLITAILFGSFISAQAMTKKSSFFNLGNSKYMTKWGQKTYGIYLLHPIATTVTYAFLEYFGVEVPGSFVKGLLIAAFVYGLTFFISWLSYTYYEAFFLKIKKRFQYIKSWK